MRTRNTDAVSFAMFAIAGYLAGKFREQIAAEYMDMMGWSKPADVIESDESYEASEALLAARAK